MEAVAVGAKEAILLSATNLPFYGRTFFPNTLRQASPEFHYTISDELMRPEQRRVAVAVFRDGAKTTLTRLYISNRIAFRISHTILVVSASQAHSIHTVRWIKNQIQKNTLWATTFGLSKGAKWSDEWIEIKREYLDPKTGKKTHDVCSVLALGITGQVRGYNLDDRRPDLIVCDDTGTDEAAASVSQSEKLETLTYGALFNSLAPESENPNAKIVVLDTPKSRHDLITSCKYDKDWRYLEFGIFDENGNSRWEARWPTAKMREEKESHIQKGKLHLWLREKECVVANAESVFFSEENLQYWETIPKNAAYLISIDPASSDAKTADDCAVVLTAFHGNKVYVVDYKAAQGQNPDHVRDAVLQYARQYRVLGLAVETVSYQRILKWYLEKEMTRFRCHIPVFGVQDSRKKADRILQAVGTVAGRRQLFVHKSQDKLIQQYCDFPPVSKLEHDDVIDAVAMAILFMESQGFGMAENDEDVPGAEYYDDDSYKAINFRGAP